MFWLPSVLLAATCQVALRAEVPPELLAAQQARRFVNARIEWSYEPANPDAAAQPPGVHAGVYTRHELLTTTPLANGQVLSTLFCDGRFWRNSDSRTASISPVRQDGMFDARTIGMVPFGVTEGLDSATVDVLGTGQALSYDVGDDGAYRLVTTYAMTSQGPEPRLQQWIDPRRGWSVVRSRQIGSQGQIIGESVRELRQFGDVWFPDQVTVTRPGVSSGPYAVLKVAQARFNDPSIPARLTPADIGVEVGTNVYEMDREGRARLRGWDGEKIQDFDVVAGRVNRGELQLGPRFQTQMRGGRRSAGALLATLRTLFGDPLPENVNTLRKRLDPGLWATYVRSFVEFYQLDTEQEQKAWSIHAESVARAESLLGAKRKEIAAIERRMQELADMPDSADYDGATRRIGELEAVVRRPVVAVFDKQLVPRLQSLLTRAQKKRGELPR